MKTYKKINTISLDSIIEFKIINLKSMNKFISFKFKSKNSKCEHIFNLKQSELKKILTKFKKSKEVNNYKTMYN